MRWIKKHNKGLGRPIAAKQKVADKIALWLSKVQAGFAKWMGGKINPLPVVRKKYLLFSFCFMLSGYSLWLIVSPIVETKKEVEIKIQAMRFPKAPVKKQKQISTLLISPAEYRRIHGFKIYLDSLAAGAPGRTIYDSIVATRPGLMDSLLMIEEYYQIQK